MVLQGFVSDAYQVARIDHLYAFCGDREFQPAGEEGDAPGIAQSAHQIAYDKSPAIMKYITCHEYANFVSSAPLWSMRIKLFVT
jgi:hypothetical protein